MALVIAMIGAIVNAAPAYAVGSVQGNTLTVNDMYGLIIDVEYADGQFTIKLRFHGQGYGEHHINCETMNLDILTCIFNCDSYYSIVLIHSGVVDTVVPESNFGRLDISVGESATVNRIIVGSGYDTINISNNGYIGSVETGQGDDKIKIINDKNGKTDNINTGEGDDTVTVTNYIGGETHEINTGDGSDTVTVSGNNGFIGVINTGGDAPNDKRTDDDKLTIKSNTGNILAMDTGIGEDALTINSNTGVIGTMSTGDGYDNFTIEENTGNIFGIYTEGENDILNIKSDGGIIKNIVTGEDSAGDQIDVEIERGTTINNIMTGDGENEVYVEVTDSVIDSITTGNMNDNIEIKLCNGSVGDVKTGNGLYTVTAGIKEGCPVNIGTINSVNTQNGKDTINDPDELIKNPDTGNGKDNYFASDIAQIEQLFNDARKKENKEREKDGLPPLPEINPPSQSEWDEMSVGEKALWLINKERTDRDLLPMADVEPNVTGVAQDFADYLLDNNKPIKHKEDGRDLWERLEANEAISDCHDFLGYAENLDQSSGMTLPLERAILKWMYEDNGHDNLHRKAIFCEYNNNSGSPESEGFLGIGVATGTYKGG